MTASLGKLAGSCHVLRTLRWRRLNSTMASAHACMAKKEESWKGVSPSNDG